MSHQPSDYFAPSIDRRRQVLEGSAVTFWTMGGIVGLNLLLFTASAANGLVTFLVAVFLAKFLNIFAAVTSLWLLPWVGRVSSRPVIVAHSLLSILVPLAGYAAVQSIVWSWLPRC